MGFNNNIISCNSTITLPASYTYTLKTSYHILGEDIELEGFQNEWLLTQISHLNTYARIGLGKIFYEELKNNGLVFPNKIDEVIQKRLLIIERDKKIDYIIGKDKLT